MTLQQFIDKWRDKQIDFDGIYPNQCMDLMHQYVYEVLGIKDKSVLARPAAKQVYTDFVWGDLFEKIPNDPEAVPQEGDIMVWDSGEWGHIAIFVRGDVMSFESFDANYPIGSLPHIQGHTYGNVLGWLRFKSNPDEDLKDIINKLEKKIEAQLEEIIKWKTGYEKKDKKLETCRDERAQNKVEYQEHLEKIEATLKDSQKLREDLRIELKNRTDERDNLKEEVEPLKEQVTGLEEGLEALKARLSKEHKKYAELDQTYADLNKKHTDYKKSLGCIPAHILFRAIFRRCKK